MADNPPIDPSAPRAVSPVTSRNDNEESSTSTSSERTLDVEQSPHIKEDNAAADTPTIAKTKSHENEPPPDGGYGWVCVACNFFINGHTWGVNSSYAVFLSYYLSNDYFPSTSPLAYAFIGGLSVSQAMLIAPFATRIIHRYGTRVCLLLGVFFETLSLISASFCTQKYQIILAQGLCFGYGIGFLFVGSVGIIPQWFTTKRSLANAVAAAGSGLGGLIYSLATQSMIDNLGLPWAFRILGIVTFTVNLTAATFLRDRNTQVGSRHKAFDTHLLRRPEFLLLQGWSIFSMLGYVVVLFSLPAYAHAIGLTPQQGSVVGALLNLGQMLGRPLIGLASDKYGRLNVATFFTALEALFVLAFWIPDEVLSLPTGRMGLLSFFAIVGGALAGTFWCTVAVVGAEVVGLKSLPAGLSLTWLMIVPPTTFAEPIALEIRRQGPVLVGDGGKKWQYIWPQIFTAVMYAAAALCLWVVRGWKVGEGEEVERRAGNGFGSGGSVVDGNGSGVNGGSEKETGGLGANGAGMDTEKRVIEKEDQAMMRRTRSESIVKAGWNRRDLLRRMCVWKKV